MSLDAFKPSSNSTPLKSQGLRGRSTRHGGLPGMDAGCDRAFYWLTTLFAAKAQVVRRPLDGDLVRFTSRYSPHQAASACSMPRHLMCRCSPFLPANVQADCRLGIRYGMLCRRHFLLSARRRMRVRRAGCTAAAGAKTLSGSRQTLSVIVCCCALAYMRIRRHAFGKWLAITGGEFRCVVEHRRWK